MRSRRGFLLLEAMVAIIVLTSGLLFVMRVYSTAKEAIFRSRELFKCSLLLEEKMYDFEERGLIEEGRDEGYFPGAKKYSWKVEANSLEAQEPALGGLCGIMLEVNKYPLWTYLEKKK